MKPAGLLSCLVLALCTAVPVHGQARVKKRIDWAGTYANRTAAEGVAQRQAALKRWRQRHVKGVGALTRRHRATGRRVSPVSCKMLERCAADRSKCPGGILDVALSHPLGVNRGKWRRAKRELKIAFYGRFCPLSRRVLLELLFPTPKPAQRTTPAGGELPEYKPPPPPATIPSALNASFSGTDEELGALLGNIVPPKACQLKTSWKKGRLERITLNAGFQVFKREISFGPGSVDIADYFHCPNTKACPMISLTYQAGNITRARVYRDHKLVKTARVLPSALPSYRPGISPYLETLAVAGRRVLRHEQVIQASGAAAAAAIKRARALPFKAAYLGEPPPVALPLSLSGAKGEPGRPQISGALKLERWDVYGYRDYTVLAGEAPLFTRQIKVSSRQAMVTDRYFCGTRGLIDLCYQILYTYFRPSQRYKRALWSRRQNLLSQLKAGARSYEGHWREHFPRSGQITPAAFERKVSARHDGVVRAPRQLPLYLPLQPTEAAVDARLRLTAQQGERVEHRRGRYEAKWELKDGAGAVILRRVVRYKKRHGDKSKLVGLRSVRDELFCRHGGALHPYRKISYHFRHNGVGDYTDHLGWLEWYDRGVCAGELVKR